MEELQGEWWRGRASSLSRYPEVPGWMIGGAPRVSLPVFGEGMIGGALVISMSHVAEGRGSGWCCSSS